MKQPQSETLALRPTALANLDPRTKLVLTLMYTLAVVSVPFDEPLLLFPLAVPFALAVGAGDVPWGYLVRRLLLGVPFVILIVLFPLLFQRDPVTVRLAGLEVHLSQGAVRSMVVSGKFVLAFGAVIVLTATTGFAKICDAMARLKLPSVFVAAVAMVWRYLFVLLDEVQRMRRARAGRSCARMSLRLAWTSSAAIVGSLFLRALSRSERVHGAMLARGFTGEMPTPLPLRMKGIDWAVIVAGHVYLGGCLSLMWS
ncbi:cobalt ECF transporter T component CbiQ [Planctomycetota bacterium]